METGLAKLRIGDLVALGHKTCLTVDREPFKIPGVLGGDHHLIGAGGRLWCVRTGNLFVDLQSRRYDSRAHVISVQQRRLNQAADQVNERFLQLAERMGVTEDSYMRDSCDLGECLSLAALSELLQLITRADEILDLAAKRAEQKLASRLLEDE